MKTCAPGVSRVLVLSPLAPEDPCPHSRREITWTVWGDEREVAERISASGATVRDASRLSLEDATLALLRAGSAA